MLNVPLPTVLFVSYCTQVLILSLPFSTADKSDSVPK